MNSLKSKSELIKEIESLKKQVQNFERIKKQHKGSENLLIKSEKKYRDLFEKSEDAILIIKNGKFVDCNQATVKMLRYGNKNELLDTHPSELSPEKQPEGKPSFEKADEMMSIAIKNGSHRFEWDHKKSDGEVFPAEVLLTSIAIDDDNQILHTVWRDITERKNVEKELLGLKQLVRKLTNPLSLNNVGKVIAEEAYNLFNYDAFSLDIIDEASDMLVGIYSEDTIEGQGKPKEASTSSHDLKSIIKKDVLNGKPKLINRKKKLNRSNFYTYGVETRLSMSLMFVPIKYENKIIGIITVQSYTAAKYQDNDLSLFQVFADHAGGAIIRSQKEEALRKSEEKLSNIFNNSVVGFYRTTPNGKIIWANQTLVKMLGFNSFEELAERNLEETGFEPDYPRSEFKRIIEEDGRVLGLESHWHKKDGSIVYVSENATVIRDDKGNTIYYDGTVENITDRKKAEEALQESEKQLQTLIDAMPDFVCFKDGDGRWLKANEAGIRIFRLGGIDYRGKKDSELAEIDNHLRGTFLTCKESDAKAWKEGGLFSGEEIVSHPDGSVRIYDVIKVPVYHPGGKRKGLVVLGHDITERKQVEEELKKYHDHLEELVQERTAELEEKNNELEKYNELFVGREFRIKELRNKLKVYEDKFGKND